MTCAGFDYGDDDREEDAELNAFFARWANRCCNDCEGCFCALPKNHSGFCHCCACDFVWGYDGIRGDSGLLPTPTIYVEWSVAP